MIPIPAGWRHHHGAHLVSLYPPGGGGRIRYYERLPLARASAVVARVLGDDPAFRVTAVGKTEPYLTGEGEHGLFVPLQGVRDHGRVARSIAIVHTDEFAAALDTLVVAPERHAELELKSRELMVEMSFGLGVRRRRFVYQPPPGWWAMPSGLIATWYPPRYPRERANIAVHPAEPRAEFTWAETEAAEYQESASAGLQDPSAMVVTPIAAPWPFQGRCFRVTGQSSARRPVLREIVLLWRAPYVYQLRLDTALVERRDELHAVLLRIAESARALPAAATRQITPAAGSSLSAGHWVE
jgi:hypothetical protein